MSDKPPVETPQGDLMADMDATIAFCEATGRDAHVDLRNLRKIRAALITKQDAAAEIATLTQDAAKVLRERYDAEVRAEAAEAELATMSYCPACEMHWRGPYTDCPGCQAQAAMKAIADASGMARACSIGLRNDQAQSAQGVGRDSRRGAGLPTECQETQDSTTTDTSERNEAMTRTKLAAVIRTVTEEMREAVPTQADWHVESSAVARWHDALLGALCPGVRATHPQTLNERSEGVTSLRCNQCDPGAK